MATGSMFRELRIVKYTLTSDLRKILPENLNRSHTFVNKNQEQVEIKFHNLDMGLQEALSLIKKMLTGEISNNGSSDIPSHPQHIRKKLYFAKNCHVFPVKYSSFLESIDQEVE